jgi:hypothetical protein
MNDPFDDSKGYLYFCMMKREVTRKPRCKREFKCIVCGNLNPYPLCNSCKEAIRQKEKEEKGRWAKRRFNKQEVT